MTNDKLISLIRERHPLIHHITNCVTVNDCANITLSIGGRPIMASCPEEAAEITSSASALLLNIGTLMADSLNAMIISGETARKINIPVIFDPVGCGASAYRNRAAVSYTHLTLPTILLV